MQLAQERLPVLVADPGDGLPVRVSPSQVATFHSCGLKYYFVSILGWREPESRATVTGVIVHDALEQLYRLPEAERTAYRAQKLLQDRAVAKFSEPSYALFRDDGAVASKAKAAVANLFEIENPMTLDVSPDGLEAPSTAVLGGVQFGGRLDRRTDGLVPRITDYKTGVRAQPMFLEDKLRQLYLYAAAEQAAGRGVAEVELLFLGGEGARVRRPVYAEVLNDATTALITMRARSQTALTDMTFEARRSPLCRFCKFRPACPQFAGSAPPPGSTASNLTLVARGLQQRRRPSPQPLERLADDDSEEG